MIGDSNDESTFPHRLLLTNRQVSKPPEAFASNSSTSISKTQLSKLVQSGGYFGRLLGQLMKVDLPFMKNLPKL